MFDLITTGTGYDLHNTTSQHILANYPLAELKSEFSKAAKAKMQEQTGVLHYLGSEVGGLLGKITGRVMGTYVTNEIADRFIAGRGTTLAQSILTIPILVEMKQLSLMSEVDYQQILTAEKEVIRLRLENERVEKEAANQLASKELAESEFTVQETLRLQAEQEATETQKIDQEMADLKRQFALELQQTSSPQGTDLPETREEVQVIEQPATGFFRTYFVNPISNGATTVAKSTYNAASVVASSAYNMVGSLANNTYKASIVVKDNVVWLGEKAIQISRESADYIGKLANAAYQEAYDSLTPHHITKLGNVIGKEITKSIFERGSKEFGNSAEITPDFYTKKLDTKSTTSYLVGKYALTTGNIAWTTSKLTSNGIYNASQYLYELPHTIHTEIEEAAMQGWATPFYPEED
ncbi:hypothetical protein [Candidatus Paracaedibacter symbiosus]|uniref:hypothetical protein n=1 Tax=Candidatus Paracaedibacter symbiosus TaxID=244582 RepID=UPI0005097BAC|nr:hypothetical protein [Candidatus Paracaedibacter symbiosus]